MKFKFVMDAPLMTISHRSMRRGGIIRIVKISVLIVSGRVDPRTFDRLVEVPYSAPAKLPVLRLARLFLLPRTLVGCPATYSGGVLPRDIYDPRTHDVPAMDEKMVVVGSEDT